MAAVCTVCGNELRAGARFCDNCGTRVEQPVADALAELRTVTVLFADLKGFTSLSEQLDPDEVHEVVQQVFSITDRCIRDQDGHVEKHMGDAVMAVFGTPRSHEDDPARAIRAALAFQTEVAQLSEKLQAQGYPAISMRVGVNTGRVVVGTVGGGSARERSVYGDAVNVASRLETACPPGGVLVSHETYRQVRGLFEVQGLPPIHVKGKSEPVLTYLITKAKKAHLFIGTQEVLGFETDMVGRGVELGGLVDALKRIEDLQPRMVLVTSQPGLGKTRLLHEFLKHVEAMPRQIFLMRARATRDTEGQPYQLFGQLIKASAGIGEHQSAKVARGLLRDWVHRRLGGKFGDLGLPDEKPAWDASYFDEATHFLGEVIGLPFPDSPHIAGALGEAVQVRNGAFLAMERIIVRGARVAPMVLEIEDLQWADAPSLAFLQHLLRSARDARLLIAAATRPELMTRDPSWSEMPRCRYIALEPLPPRRMRQLFEHLLRFVDGVTPALLDSLVKQGGGTPYFAEEVVKALADDGVIAPAGSGWRVAAADLSKVDLPASVEAVVQGRLDRLKPNQREVVRVAAVIGMSFWEHALADLLGYEVDDLADTLDLLMEREIIRHQPRSSFEPHREFVFVHDLMRQVAYRGLVKRSRRTHHRDLAEWLEEHVGERSQAWQVTIAGHYAAGGIKSKASRWYLRAADTAASSYGDDATVLYERALATGGLEAADAARAHLACAQIRERTGAWDEALLDLQRAHAYASSAGFSSLRSECHSVRSRLHILAGRFDQAIGEAEAALVIAEEAEDVGAIATALSTLATARNRRGDLIEGQALEERMLALQRDLGDARGVARTQLHMAVTRHRQGHADQAMALFVHAEAALRKVGDRAALAQCLHHMGYLMQEQGNYDKALRWYRESLDIRNSIGDRIHAAWNLHNMARIHLERGDSKGARRLIDAERDISEALGPWPGEGYGWMNLGNYHLWKGELDEALACHQRSLQVFVDHGEKPLQAHELDRLAEVHRARGELTEAVQRSNEAAGIRQELSRVSAADLVNHHVIRADIALQRDDAFVAAAEVEAAEGQTSEDTVPLWIAIQLRLARVAIARNDPTDAAVHAQWCLDAEARHHVSPENKLLARAIAFRADPTGPAQNLLNVVVAAEQVASDRGRGLVRAEIAHALVDGRHLSGVKAMLTLPPNLQDRGSKRLWETAARRLKAAAERG